MEYPDVWIITPFLLSNNQATKKVEGSKSQKKTDDIIYGLPLTL